MILESLYNYQGQYISDYTDYEEVWKTHYANGTPEWDFYFNNQYWVATNGTKYTPTWDAWTYNVTGEKVPNGVSEDVNLNGVGGVRINNPGATDNLPNIPPAASGPTSGVTNQLYTYNTSTTNPEGYNLYYVFDWGDGSNTTVGPYQSGAMASASHSWSSPGNYYIFVEAIDTWIGGASGWGGSTNPVVIQNPPPPSGCPYVSTWNGNGYVLDNNLLAASMFSQGADVNDHYVLQQTLAQNPNGTYSLLLSEFENEHDFIDQVQLVAVDHASNVNMGISPEGQILTYGTPNQPVSAITDTHENVKQLLSAIDGTYYEAHNGSCVILNFGNLDISQGAKLVLRADYWKDPVFVQVQNSNGRWITVAHVIPRVNWSTDIIDISKFLPDANGNLKVRLCFTADLKVDFVGLDTSPQATLNIHKGQLVSAISSIEGDVTAKLLHTDQTYAVLVPGENIQLQFTLPTQTMETRTYIILARGHYYTLTL